jgi:hypothetical protein
MAYGQGEFRPQGDAAENPYNEIYYLRLSAFICGFQDQRSATAHADFL